MTLLEDREISMFAGLLSNHDHTHSLGSSCVLESRCVSVLCFGVTMCLWALILCRTISRNSWCHHSVCFCLGILLPVHPRSRESQGWQKTNGLCRIYLLKRFDLSRLNGCESGCSIRLPDNDVFHVNRFKRHFEVISDIDDRFVYTATVWVLHKTHSGFALTMRHKNRVDRYMMSCDVFMYIGFRSLRNSDFIFS